MTLKSRSGFTLVEIAVAMGLMAVVMVMVVTAFLLINEYSARETGFFDTMTALTETEKRFTEFVSDRDAAACTFSTDSGGDLCVFDELGMVKVTAFDKPWLSVRFSRMDAYNTDYCEFTWTDADDAVRTLNFDTLAWSRQPWAAGDEQRICSAIYAAFGETLDPEFQSGEDGALLIYNAAELYTYRAALENAAELAAQGKTTEEIEEPTPPAPLVTLTPREAGEDGPGLSYYRQDGEWFCRVSPEDGASTAAYSFRLTLPPAVLTAHCEVLAWGQANAAEGVRFGIASAVLRVRDSETGEETLMCYVSGESSAVYVTGFLRRGEEHNNLVLTTGHVPLVANTFSGLEFVSMENVGILCRMSHTMRGEPRVMDCLAPTRAAVLT